MGPVCVVICDFAHLASDSFKARRHCTMRAVRPAVVSSSVAVGRCRLSAHHYLCRHYLNIRTYTEDVSVPFQTWCSSKILKVTGWMALAQPPLFTGHTNVGTHHCPSLYNLSAPPPWQRGRNSSWEVHLQARSPLRSWSVILELALHFSQRHYVHLKGGPSECMRSHPAAVSWFWRDEALFAATVTVCHSATSSFAVTLCAKRCVRLMRLIVPLLF